MKKKVLSIIFVLFMVLFSFNNVSAATNDKYGSHDIITDITDDVVKESIVTEYISQFVFAIGNVLESVTSWIFGLLTGANSFPWADEIIFNTIDLLDVNFINPSPNSLFASNGIGIGDVIRGIYFTGLSIAIGFLSIIVGVMAIRMAVSSIASEKAKYKEAIAKWLTSLVLLFGMHYCISFLFYVNEQLVVVASEILNDVLDNVGDKLAQVMNATTLEKKKEKVSAALNDAAYQASQEMAGQLFNPFFLGQNLGSLLFTSTGTDISNFDYGDYDNGLMITTNQIDIAATLWSYLEINYEVTYELIRNSTVKEYVLDAIHDSSGGWLGNLWDGITNVVGGLFGQSQSLDALIVLYEMAAVIQNPEYGTEVSWINMNVEDAIQSYDTYLNSIKNIGTSENEKLKKVVLEYAYKYKIGALGVVSGTDLIANLGQYFKDDTWASGDGWKTTSGSVTSAILYTVFVIQSIGFFVSYIRRLFMVTVLAIISPFVIIYDFFMKSAVGSKNSVFNSWFRELCTLIFVQTFQAFLLAIIMSVIVSLTASSYLTDSNGISAVGILAVFALLSLPRIELLLKNIFGLTSGVADTSLAAGQKSSFAGGILALRAGRRLIDNPRKIIGGAKNAIQGQLRLREATNNKYDAEIANRMGTDALPSGQTNPGMGPTRRIGSTNSEGAITKLSDNIAELTKELQREARSTETKDKGDKLKDLEAAIKDAKNARNEGLKSMFTGTMETIGAAHGAVAGGVIGMAKGEVGDMVLKGAGVGDVVGEAVSKAVAAAPKTVKETKTGLKAEIRAHVNEPSKSAYKKFEEELKKENKKNFEEIDKKLYEYTKQMNMNKKDVKVSSSKTTPRPKNNIDAGNMQ